MYNELPIRSAVLEENCLVRTNTIIMSMFNNYNNNVVTFVEKMNATEKRHNTINYII